MMCWIFICKFEIWSFFGDNVFYVIFPFTSL